MPRDLERELEGRARRKGLGKKRRNAYVYGTLRKVAKRQKRRR